MSVRVGAGTLTTCWDSYSRNGVVTTEKLWLYLPDDGERWFVGLVADMTQEQAVDAVRKALNDAEQARSERIACGGEAWSGGFAENH